MHARGDVARNHLEFCARRVYALQRAAGLKRRRRPHEGRIPAWDELPEPVRSRLIADYWRVRASYDVGRREPSEVRIQ